MTTTTPCSAGRRRRSVVPLRHFREHVVVLLELGVAVAVGLAVAAFGLALVGARPHDGDAAREGEGRQLAEAPRAGPAAPPGADQGRGREVEREARHRQVRGDLVRRRRRGPPARRGGRDGEQGVLHRPRRVLPLAHDAIEPRAAVTTGALTTSLTTMHRAVRPAPAAPRRPRARSSPATGATTLLTPGTAGPRRGPCAPT